MSGAPLSLSPSGKARLIDWFVPVYELLAEQTYALATHVHIAQTGRQLLSGIGITASQSAQEKKRRTYLEQAIQYMNGRLDATLTLPELAKHVGVSKQHLIYIFNAETGVSRSSISCGSKSSGPAICSILPNSALRRSALP